MAEYRTRKLVSSPSCRRRRRRQVRHFLEYSTERQHIEEDKSERLNFTQDQTKLYERGRWRLLSASHNC